MIYIYMYTYIMCVCVLGITIHRYFVMLVGAESKCIYTSEVFNMFHAPQGP